MSKKSRFVDEELHKLRLRSLQFCYDLSEGNSLKEIQLSVLAEKLLADKVEIKDSKDIKLLGAIQYLEDKGFLEQTFFPTHVVRITHLGIDEVEFIFPTL